MSVCVWGGGGDHFFATIDGIYKSGQLFCISTICLNADQSEITEK